MAKKKEKSLILRVSVRELVEFVLRSGDLDNRYGVRRDMEAMQAGSRLHQKIQKRMGPSYHPEVTLKYAACLGGIPVSVEGRADGIWIDEGVWMIDEIKGTYKDIHRMDEPVPVHLAQAKCYAFIYGEQNGLSLVKTRMIYASLDTEETRCFTQEYTYEELKLWFEALLKEYERWIVYEAWWKTKRTESLKRLVFPYPYREGQKELAVSVYKTILRKKRLFIQAPTGVGKTLSTLFPSLKAMGEGLEDKIFYLTARTVTRTVAGEALSILREQGVQVKSVMLTAKEKLCICEKAECNPDACPYARGHFDRINEAVYDLWTKGPDSIDRETILAQAHRYKVCPFELNLDVSLWVDVVICDYNYVFDPNVCLKRFFSEGGRGEYLFLVDEAHNLVERGRAMYSAVLAKEDFLEIKRLIGGKSAALMRALERCNRHLLALKRECENGYQCLKQADGFALHLTHLMGELDRFMEMPIPEELGEPLRDFYFQVRNFLNIYERVDENYEIYTEFSADGRFLFHLYCVRPAANLKLCLDKGNSAVFFSATLLPIHYYKDLLTGEEQDYAVYAGSPFDTEKRLLLVGTDVSSRYTRRTGQTYDKITEYILQAVRSRKGNYLIFFPSYQMLEEIYKRCTVWKDVLWICQKSGMDEQERESFLEQFEEGRLQSMAAFCVMGGIFSEGIDLAGGRLIGAVIVGTGLPKVCREREILRNYFDRSGMDGFAYAYQYPGMNKVLQAAGRVIRTDEDRGIILLLDERFISASYRRLFPREWESHIPCRLNAVRGYLDTFWHKMDQM